jgi:hypothetical protein
MILLIALPINLKLTFLIQNQTIIQNTTQLTNIQILKTKNKFVQHLMKKLNKKQIIQTIIRQNWKKLIALI